MKLKADWKTYIRELRIEEIELIIPYMSDKSIQKGLELGAGNGFQSKMLVEHMDRLCCTELNEERLVVHSNDRIEYKIADAEKITEHFEPNSFDIIYSSNLFEHLPNPPLAIRGCQQILKDSGLMIHIIPSTFNAIARLVLWYPDLLASTLDKYLFQKTEKKDGAKESRGNNLKLPTKQRNKFLKLIIPRPHGVSNNVFSELYAFSKARWEKEFRENGFEIIKTLKGPVYSGYGLGLKRIKRLMAALGFTSEYVYIVKKSNA